MTTTPAEQAARAIVKQWYNGSWDMPEPLIAAILAYGREREAAGRQAAWGEAINIVNYAAETMARFAKRDFESAAKENCDGK